LRSRFARFDRLPPVVIFGLNTRPVASASRPFDASGSGEALGQVCIELTEEDRPMVRETNAATKADQELDAVKDHIQALRSELATLTTHIKGLSSAKLEQAQTAGTLKFEELSADLQRAADAIRQQGQASIAQFENTVREKPLISLLAAFGAGVLVARLLERK
jgi:ElaB/YqjD/DUF883 family membrane-anchored ribosome-binding protein